MTYPIVPDPAVPLVDLHRHLEGSMRLETIQELCAQFGAPLPCSDLTALSAYVQVTAPQPGLMAFIARIDRSVQVLGDLDACRRIAYECVIDAREEGIDYLELRFSPRYMAQPHGLNAPDVVAAVVDGAEAAAFEVSIKVNLIGILSRTYGVEACWEELRALQAHHTHIKALDLAGDEGRWPAQLFEAHFQQARELGWEVTVHAGEAVGPESVWTAIRQLGATRIGHALRAIEDPALMDYMAEHHIAVESSLTSNVQTSAISDYAAHPIRTYMTHGMLVTLNTDDPAISRITLAHEYTVAAPAAGLTREDLRRIQKNGLAAAFLTPGERRELEEAKLRSAGLSPT